MKFLLAFLCVLPSFMAAHARDEGELRALGGMKGSKKVMKEFEGYYIGMDPVDGGDSRTSIYTTGDNKFTILRRDTNVGLCGGLKAAIITGEGSVDSDGVLTATGDVKCIENDNTADIKMEYKISSSGVLLEDFYANGNFLHTITFYEHNVTPKKSKKKNEFVGYYMGIDPVDGGDSRTSIQRIGKNKYEVLRRDTNVGLCGGLKAAIISGEGSIEDGILTAVGDVKCIESGASAQVKMVYFVDSKGVLPGISCILLSSGRQIQTLNEKWHPFTAAQVPLRY